MLHALNIGPFSVPMAVLIPIVAIFTGLFAGEFLLRKTRGSDERADDADTEARPRSLDRPYLWQSILPALVIARLVHVAQFWPAYAGSIGSMIDIRDGGFHIWAGVLAAWLLALWHGRRQPVFRRPLITAMICMTAIGLIGQEVLLAPSRKPIELPPLAFKTLDGDSVALHNYAARPMVINLWATWCPHCVREMPVLEKAQQQYPQVHIVLVNQGENASQVQRFLQARSLSLQNMLLDEQKSAGQHFGMRALPATLFIDRRGQLVSVRIGALSEATLQKHIDELLRRG